MTGDTKCKHGAWRQNCSVCCQQNSVISDNIQVGDQCKHGVWQETCSECSITPTTLSSKSYAELLGYEFLYRYNPFEDKWLCFHRSAQKRLYGPYQKGDLITSGKSLEQAAHKMMLLIRT